MSAAVIKRNRILTRRVMNFSASFLFVTCAYVAYQLSPHTVELRDFSNTIFAAPGVDLLTICYAFYSVFLLIFYFTERTANESKSVTALRAVRTLALSPFRTIQHGLPFDQRLGLLTILLKGFFAPLMLLSLFQLASAMVANGSYLLNNPAAIRTDFLETFNTHGFSFLLQAILFLDVFFFTIGYLIEHPRLVNEIRSVDPTWLGWAVTLACYPPFNVMVSKIMGWSGTEFPQFTNPIVHVVANLLLLLFMAIYTWASVALNLKASNLTHRGIISRGPYRYIRHPAYVCKNAAWWIAAVPAVIASWNVSAWDAVVVGGSALAWSAIYLLRALTEEDHLRKVDGEYDAYCREVPHRFIPGVY
jgi:protein-S-isoprenylcysteine O-methyltransferase Ste14